MRGGVDKQGRGCRVLAVGWAGCARSQRVWSPSATRTAPREAGLCLRARPPWWMRGPQGRSSQQSGRAACGLRLAPPLLPPRPLTCKACALVAPSEGQLGEGLSPARPTVSLTHCVSQSQAPAAVRQARAEKGPTLSARALLLATLLLLLV